MTTTHDALSPAELQARAREAYRQSVERGEPMTRDQLGAAFSKSSSWARDRIAEVRQQADMSGDTGGTATAVTDTAKAVSTGLEVPAASSPAGAEVSGDNPLVARDMSPTVAAVTGDTAAVSPVGTAPPMAPSTAVDVAPDNRADTAPDSHDVSPAEPPRSHHAGALFVCWLGFLLGTVVSVAANWLAAWLSADQHPPGWKPSLWAQGFAAVWPIALVVSVEVLSRVAWPSGKGWALVRYSGMLAVALCSFVISYGHIHEVLLSWGYGTLGSAVGPLVIDGLMVVSGFGLLALSKTRGGR